MNEVIDRLRHAIAFAKERRFIAFSIDVSEAEELLALLEATAPSRQPTEPRS